ncbi:cell envelope integrity protein CreD [Paramagnetospirillum magneticum]|uniref:Inner membrane protein involved in colicin E2 resistance n=1 Tax=Paramagnetospirillum magneticum (strain ATCC 700264 / AMB-1) TaxID=342108 RepID=Q2W678_PARM1|nr:cell envelope integrity protein CreD [Paramagnetospirillum magneticum]BAE50647.1 Inner membrane protein involved in colicin E2 resistance [Paramagnetospirillum magneticum AMB-1]
MTDNPFPPPNPANPWTSPTRKIGMIAALLVASLIPGWMISSLVAERESRQMEMSRDFAQSWGPEQTLTTPVLVVPYKPAADQPRHYLKIPSSQVTVTARLSPETRKRGLFSATVYSASVEMQGSFRIPHQVRLAASMVNGSAGLLWQESFIILGSSKLAGMSSASLVVGSDQRIAWQNCWEISATDEDCKGSESLLGKLSLASPPGAGTTLPFHIAANVRGTQSLSLLSQAQALSVTMSAPWQTPSFSGSTLPLSSSLSEAGFEAQWQAVNYGAPQSWSSRQFADPGPSSATRIKVDLLDPTPAYRMIHRASKYDALFLALSFATYFLFEALAKKRIHLVQYGLMGLSVTLFPLLLLSIAEPLGYDRGFLLGALLVLTQASLYTGAVARRFRETALFAAMLALLFGFIYVLLSLETYSLLAGSLALFAVLSLVMLLTRRIDWSSWNTPGKGTAP